MIFSLLFVALCTAQSTTYLSGFGDDTKDCLSAANACRSLTRGVAVAKSVSGTAKVLSLDAAVFSLTSTSILIDFPLTIRGVGRTLTSIACASTSSTGLLNIGNPSGTVSFENLAFDTCSIPVEIGRSTPYNVDRRVEFTSVHFRNCDGAVLGTSGRDTVVFTDTLFSPYVTSSPRGQILMGTGCDAFYITLTGNTKFDLVKTSISSAAAVIDMSVNSGYPRSLTINPGVVFGGTSDPAGFQRSWISQLGGTMRVNGTVFNNRASVGCAVAGASIDMVITSSRFVGTRNTSALCVTGTPSVAQVVSSTFDDNEGVSGGAISLTNGQLSIRGTTFNNNRAIGSSGMAGIGGAIYCNGGRLTVLDSIFTNNAARSAAVASCTTCQTVFNGNSATTNTESTDTTSCGVALAPAAPTPGGNPTPVPVSNPTPPPTPAGGSSTPTPGGSSTPTPGGNATPTPGGNATPTPGGNATPTPGGNSTPTPGGNSTPTPGGNSTPTPGGNNPSPTDINGSPVSNNNNPSSSAGAGGDATTTRAVDAPTTGASAHQLAAGIMLLVLLANQL